MNLYRCLSLISKSINLFNLNLSDLQVFTEAATGYYSLTPIIALLAGAQKVYALGRDSSYGSKEEAFKKVFSIAKTVNCERNIEFLDSKNDDRISNADIITNLGFVRPIDRNLIWRLKSTSAISLMFETWECRKEDVDLEACLEREIPVLGTNESYPGLDIMNYIGLLAIKLAFELDIEVRHNNIVVVGGGAFGRSTVNVFEQLGSRVINIQVKRGDSLSEAQTLNEIRDSDLIVFVEYENRDKLLGPGGQLELETLLRVNPSISIVHIAGVVDETAIKESNIPFMPKRIGKPGYMSVATDYLGPKPLIDLHTAGLKVGESLAKARLKGHTREEAIQIALQTSPAQDFKSF
jgi:hypothetical protein